MIVRIGNGDEIEGLNWTKIGLKLQDRTYRRSFEMGLNWTKIGLKRSVDALTFASTNVV